MDNWYNSISLANELLKNHNLTVMGTLRKNKSEIPLGFLETKKKRGKFDFIWIWKRPSTYILYFKQK